MLRKKQIPSMRMEKFLSVVVVGAVVLGLACWVFGEWEEQDVAEWKEGEYLEVVLACPPSYKVAMLALLKSLKENSVPDWTRVWIFQEDSDNEESDIMRLLRTEDIFPVENIWFVNYSKSEYLESLLTKIEEDFDSRSPHSSFSHNPSSSSSSTPPSSFSQEREADIPEEEKKHRNHKLMVDQHNYIRFYIPSIFNSLSSLSPSSFSAARSYPPKPKQFLYLDCDMIALRDPMILMNQVAPHLGKGNQNEEQEDEKRIETQEREREGEEEKSQGLGEWEGKMCLAAAERSDPLLVDSLGRGEEAQKVVKELGIDDEMKSFNAGMLVVDTDCWHETQALERILFWMELRTQRPIYQKGSQPPLLLSFLPQGSKLTPSDLYPSPMEYFVVGDEWDFQARNLGHTDDNVGIVHYNGKKKPWQFYIEDPVQQKTWDHYAIPSLLPPDRPTTAPDETSQEKAERREGELIRERLRLIEKEERAVLRLKVREEKERMKQLEKEEKERQKQEAREERERKKQQEREEREREKQEAREERERQRDNEREQKRKAKEEREKLKQMESEERARWREERNQRIFNERREKDLERERRRQRRKHGRDDDDDEESWWDIFGITGKGKGWKGLISWGEDKERFGKKRRKYRLLHE